MARLRQFPILYAVALFLTVFPMLCGTGFHAIYHCPHQACGEHGHAHTCPTHHADHAEDPATGTFDVTHDGDADCPICEFLAMPRDRTPSVATIDQPEFLERRVEACLFFDVALYRDFQPGRAPPCVSV